jgi:apolipoprotein N-acyltransferase
VPGVPPFGPLICYEAIFPGSVIEPGVRPAWLLNVTNDGWFGDTPGPRQHFQQARLRAVEEGVPMVRAANSGISAIIDPYGRVTASIPAGRTDVIDATLPAALAPTVTARFGQLVLIALLLTMGTAIPLCKVYLQFDPELTRM